VGRDHRGAGKEPAAAQVGPRAEEFAREAAKVPGTEVRILVPDEPLRIDGVDG
jgi:hypothetical protein